MTETGTFVARAVSEQRPAQLVEEDPGLFAALPPAARLEARSHAVAPAIRLERGRWDPRTAGPRERAACLGLLVLDGLLVHSAVVATRPRSEVVGPGDVLRPWQQEEEVATLPFGFEWEVVQPARLALLNARFNAFACRWPDLVLEIVSRTVRRSHRLALQLAIADVRRMEDRLILFLWHVADRWGRVGPDGVVVPLPVTHEVLAQLVCAERPSVTSALKRLSDAGRIRRRPDRTWLLASEPPQALARVRSAPVMP